MPVMEWCASPPPPLPLTAFLDMSHIFLPSIVSKNALKNIGHHARERDVMDLSYPIYPCITADHARASLIGSR